METLYLTHPACRLHEMGDWHPECPARLDAINDQLLASGLASYLNAIDAPAATLAQIAAVHTPAYIAAVQAASPTSGYRELAPDTLMNAHTWQAALHAAGAGVAAVDAIMAGQAQTAFCAVRPPGHHAMPDEAMGFCFFNNVMIAARHAIDRHGLTRVAIVDFDVHHGNGTEAMVANDTRLLMCGFFQHPLFPGSGVPPMADNVCNAPIAAYSNGDVVRQQAAAHWLPRLRAFAPQMIFISAGFDAHREDDMAQLGLVEKDYVWLTEQIVHVADESAQGRIVSCLEGGYNLSALGRSACAHIRAMAKL